MTLGTCEGGLCCAVALTLVRSLSLSGAVAVNMWSFGKENALFGRSNLIDSSWMPE
jgi:hypothetical protein